MKKAFIILTFVLMAVLAFGGVKDELLRYSIKNELLIEQQTLSKILEQVTSETVITIKPEENISNMVIDFFAPENATVAEILDWVEKRYCLLSEVKNGEIILKKWEFDNSVKVKVVKSDSGKPICNEKVDIYTEDNWDVLGLNDEMLTTDENGEIVIRNLRPGKYVVSAGDVENRVGKDTDFTIYKIRFSKNEGIEKYLEFEINGNNNKNVMINIENENFVNNLNKKINLFVNEEKENLDIKTFEEITRVFYLKTKMKIISNNRNMVLSKIFKEYTYLFDYTVIEEFLYYFAKLNKHRILFLDESTLIMKKSFDEYTFFLKKDYFYDIIFEREIPYNIGYKKRKISEILKIINILSGLNLVTQKSLEEKEAVFILKNKEPLKNSLELLFEAEVFTGIHRENNEKIKKALIYNKKYKLDE